MKCFRAVTLLNLYVDGRLPAHRFAALEEHLRGCSDCRGELAHLEMMASSLAETPVVVEPERLTTLILARIAGYEATRARSRERAFAPRWGDAVLAALLASLTTLIFVFLNPHLRTGILFSLSSFGGHLSLLATTPGSGVSSLLLWVFWVGAGCALAVWLAGAQVRSSWRRTLSHHIPQLRQPG